MDKAPGHKAGDLRWLKKRHWLSKIQVLKKRTGHGDSITWFTNGC